VSLPPDQTICRTVSVPFKDEKKIRQVLPFELEPSLPVAVDGLVIDFQSTAEPEKNGLLTVAVDRKFLEGIMETLTAVDWRPQLVVPGNFPLALALAGQVDADEENILFLSVGRKKATLFALQSQRILMVRSLGADIATDMGIEALALKIRQTVTAFSDSQPGGFESGKIYLSGPAFVDGETSRRLSEALEMTTHVVNLRKTADKLDAAHTLDQWHPCLFDDALALALVEAEGHPCPNFHRSGSPLRNYWTTYRPYLRGPIALLAAVLLLGLLGVVLNSIFLKNQVDALDAQIEAVFSETLPGTRRVGDALEQMKSEIKRAKSGGIDPENGPNQVRTIDVLLQLSQSIPKELDVVFSRLVYGNDGLTLSGEAAAFNAVDEIKGHLEKNDVFKQVTISSANMDKGGNKVLFKLKIDL
ncbi:MAG: PilN domain-containing protein, partial [Desulfatitalea sp.]|nr:PilN domain-containing protein [Desulfatitalea sp.]